MNKLTTWILVADAARACIYQTLRPLADGDLHLVAKLEHKMQPSRELGSDHPGRSFESGSAGQRHAIEPRSDPHDQQKTEFALSLAHELEQAASAGKYARLAVVAPPVLLGRLRHAFGAKTMAALVGTLDKDLTHLPAKQLAEHLRHDF